MATPEETFLKRMQLTKDEIAALDRYVGFIEQARKNPVDFIQGGSVAFTPGALLVVAVAHFAYELYKDYHKGSSFTDEEFAVEFKNVARELAELEARGEVAPSLDVYARFRRDLRESR